LSSSVPDSLTTKNDIHERDSASISQKRQSSSSCSGTITVYNQTNVGTTDIANCTSFTGDIILDAARGNFSLGTILPPGLTTLDGSIFLSNNVGVLNLDLYSKKVEPSRQNYASLGVVKVADMGHKI
jgi:hypothetical protein